MIQKEIFKMENQKEHGVNEIVLNLGEGTKSRIEKQKDNVVNIHIFMEGREWNKPKIEVKICIYVNDEGLHYEFVFKIGKGLNFMTTGLEGSAIKADASVITIE